MYNAEVLSKFPVVQHFPFGSLFSWEQDPNAPQQTSSIHTASQPASHQSSTSAPIDQASQSTRAPWATQTTRGESAPMTNPRGSTQSSLSHPGLSPTTAPWAASRGGGPAVGDSMTTMMPPPLVKPPTRAPWADKRGGKGD